jgi:oligosaccharide translocation protein RFT1
MLGDAVRGVKLMMLLQLLSRVVTFGLNALVVRQVAPEVVGVAAQLQLITNLTLFFSREAVRRALARGQGVGGELLAWAPLFPLGVASCAAVGWAWLAGASGAERAVPGFAPAVLLTLLASLVELAGEPAFALNLRAMRYRARFVIESAAVLALCGTLFVSVTVLQLGLIGWGLGQLAFAIVSALGNSVAAGGCGGGAGRSRWPTGAEARLLLAFQWQAVQQLLLQEGERLLMKLSSAPLAAQGMYAVVANLGSLLVRSIFFPLEDVAGTYFARVLSGGASRKGEAAAVLAALLHLLLTGALFVLSLGPPLAFFGLDLLYGARLSHSAAPAILRAYCGLVALLGLNGVAEAFVRAAVSPAQQYRLNVILLLIAAAQMGASLLLLRAWGGEGLVYANCLGMAMRLAYSLPFIHFNLPGFSWRATLPAWPVVVALVVARVLLSSLSPELCAAEGARMWNGRLPGAPCWLLAGVAAGCGALGLVCVAVFDRQWVAQMQSIWRAKSQ